MKRRDFLKKAGIGAAAVAATAVNAPFVHSAKKTTIKWRMQTYAGPALSAHVCKPAIDAFNKVADGEMVIELYNSDQLVPTGELFRAMQREPLTLSRVMTTPLRHRWTCPYSVRTSPLPHAIRWMFPHCSTGMG